MNDKMDNAKDALKRDWEQTKSDVPGLQGEDIDQSVGDTVKQAMGKEAAPSVDEPTKD